MNVTASPLFEAKIAENTDTTQYTSSTSGSGVTTIIDKFTATNYTGSAATVSVNLVAFGDTVGSRNLIVSVVSIAAHTCYTFPELVGHILAPGDYISTVAGTANAITIRASGRKVS